MSFRESPIEFRQRLLSLYDRDEVAKYDEWIKQLSIDDHQATLDDLQPYCPLRSGMQVLDAGAGTGALSIALSQVPGLQITALEPSELMLDHCRAKPELSRVRLVQGFCDDPSDHALFPLASFDVIASRQLTNNLFDPLAAFQNWHGWLRAEGRLIVMDGFYDRNGWSGRWERSSTNYRSLLAARWPPCRTYSRNVASRLIM